MPRARRSHTPGRLRWYATGAAAVLLAVWLASAWWAEVAVSGSSWRVGMRNGCLLIGHDEGRLIAAPPTVGALAAWPPKGERGVRTATLAERGILWTIGTPWTSKSSTLRIGNNTLVAESIAFTATGLSAGSRVSSVGSNGTMLTASGLTITTSGVPTVIPGAGGTFHSERLLALWPLVLLATLAAAWSWVRHVRAVRPGCCTRCGYDRAGLVAEAVCPECGEAANVEYAAEAPR